MRGILLSEKGSSEKKMCFPDKRGRSISQNHLFHSLPALNWDVMSRSVAAILKPRGMGEEDCSDSSLNVSEPPNQYQ